MFDCQQHMRQELFTPGPLLYIEPMLIQQKMLIEQADGPCQPCLLLRCRDPFFEHHLHKTMNGNDFLMGITTNQCVGEQVLEQGVEMQRTAQCLLKFRAHTARSSAQKCFWNLVGCQKTTQHQELGCSRVFALQVFKGQGKGGLHREGMLLRGGTLLQQLNRRGLKEVQEISEATVSLFNISTSLVQSKW